MRPIALITGATSGFGEACAVRFASNGFDLILNGRRKERLEKLKQQLESRFGISAIELAVDVRDKEAVFNGFEALPSKWKTVAVLINNAGLALGRDLFQEASFEDWETMIDTNLKGILYVSRAVIPGMIASKKGHIINIGSIAGKEAYERGNVYCATKAAVDSLSRGMRMDLLPHHIRVTAIHPGAAETEFSIVRFKGAEETAGKVYEGYSPLTADDVAQIAWFAASLPPHVCINDLVVTPTQQASAYLFDKSGKLGESL